MRSNTKAISVFSLLLFTGIAANAQWPKSCGADSAQYKVSTEKVHTLPAADANKAQVVFIETLKDNPPSVVVRYAMDGSWVGANHGNSYFALSVAPGTYHLCSTRQTGIKADKEFAGSAVVNLEAGKTYYFEFAVTHKMIGSVGRADGGSGGAGASPVGRTPDYTTKDGASVDEGSFGQLSQSEGQARLQHSSMSMSSPK
jgi:hypothetical protein